MSVIKVTPLLGFSWEPLLLPPMEFLLMMPWIGNMSRRCRLFLRDEGKPLPLDRRRCRLESTAAGDTMPRGGTFPIFSYSCSISLFWAACRACTSLRCLMGGGREVPKFHQRSYMSFKLLF